MADDFADIISSMPNPASIAASNSWADPDKAARAVNLSTATGTPASIIAQDPDRFQQQLKAHTAGAIVNQNPQLKSYILSDPNAAKVSSDDLAQLDTTSKALQGVGGPSLMTRLGRIANATAEGFGEGFDAEGFNKGLKDLYDYSSNPMWQRFAYPFVGLAAAGLGGFESIINGSFGAYEGLVRQGLEEAGASPQDAASFAAQTSEFLQFAGVAGGMVPEATGAAMAEAAGAPKELPGATPAAPVGTQTEPIEGIGQKTPEEALGTSVTVAQPPKEVMDVLEAAHKAAPYIEADRPVPPGLDKTIDDVKKEEAKADLDKIKTAFKEGLASATRDRSPEMFKDFVQQHTGEETVGVSPETVLSLYGGKEPAPDDGLLGFVPNIADQFKTMMETGADIQVPISDMMTYMTPEVFDAIQPGLRTREDLPTEFERTAKVATPEGEKPMQESGIFDTPKAIGLPQLQSARYMRAIQEQQEVEYEAALERARKAEAIRQTPEWEANRKEMEQQVIDDLTQTPKYVADIGIRNGHIPKIDADDLTPDQKANLHRAYYGKDGEPIDYVASLTGHDSGDSLVNDLAALHHDRQGRPADKHLQNLVKKETDYRMEQKYGRREDLALEGARELTLHQTNLDLMHSNLEQLAAENGLTMPFTKKGLEEGVKDSIAKMPMSSISSDKFWMAAYRASQRIRNALLNNDPITAFHGEQEKWASLVYAKEAARLEKIRKGFDKIAAKYRSKRKLPSASQEYVDQIQSLLHRLGVPTRRGLSDIQANIEKAGHAGFSDFVNKKMHDFANLQIPPFLMDEQWAKPVGRMTGQEFEDVANALKSLDFNARLEQKVFKAGREMDKQEAIGQMVEQLKKVFGEPRARKPDKAPNTGAVPQTVKSFGWSLVQFETMAARLDQDDPNGVFTQLLSRPLTDGAGHRERMLKEYGKRLNEVIGKLPNLDKIVDNKIFRDDGGNPIVMTRRNVYGVLKHMGNKSNFDKLVRGWKVDPEEVRALVKQNTTVEDWDKMQEVGDLFEELFQKGDNLSYETSGIGVVRVPLTEFTDPFGVRRKGWYSPVTYDRTMLGAPKEADIGSEALMEPGFHPATTNQRWAIERSGFAGPVDLTLNPIEYRMRQMIHDITMRQAVQQVNKFISDPKFMHAIRSYYSETAAKTFRPYLKDVANRSNVDEAVVSDVNNAIAALIRNTTSTLIGWNPGTVLKHAPTAWASSVQQVGPGWFKEFATLLKNSPVGDSNWKMFMEKSDEGQHRMRNFFDLIKGEGGNIQINASRTGAWNSYLRLRDLAQYIGQYPVAVSDILSAAPTWLAEYKKQIALGANEGDAKFAAERALRKAHGSSVFTNKPAIMRIKNPIANSVTQLYGFFNQILQKQYEVAWRTKDAYNLAREGDVSEAIAKVPKIGSMAFVYGVLPVAFEELATGGGNTREGLLHRIGRFALQASSASVPFLRDFAYSIMYPHDPNIGILNETAKGFTDVAHDIQSGREFTAAKAGKFLEHMTTMTGYLTGLTNSQEGKMAEYLANYMNHRANPHGVWDWLSGLRYGTNRGPKSPVRQWFEKEFGR